MQLLKNKPKPFSQMSKSRRFMVVSSLILIILGCLALYSAMQNQQWTKDEPSQRKVFFLASVLLISSIALCYYALNAEPEEEKDLMEEERLNCVKFDDYNSIKPDIATSYSECQAPSSNLQDKYIRLLEPAEFKLESKTNDRNRSNYKLVHGVRKQKESHEAPDSHSETRARSLIVQLMPLLPLQLCEKELQNLGIPNGGNAVKAGKQCYSSGREPDNSDAG